MEPVIIVSGLPRSGTSMIMQLLEVGGMPIATDRKRLPDDSNPRGYLEIDSVIDKLKAEPRCVFDFKGKALKVIAYGLKHLPQGNYLVIYVERNIEEVLDSMEKMTGAKDEERGKTRKAFLNLNKLAKAEVRRRRDMKVLFVDYNRVIRNPGKPIAEIHRFLREKDLDLEKMMNVVDKKLYRQRRVK